MRRERSWANRDRRPHRGAMVAAWGLAAALTPAASLVLAQSGDSFEDASIHYTQSQPTDAIAR